MSTVRFHNVTASNFSNRNPFSESTIRFFKAPTDETRTLAGIFRKGLQHGQGIAHVARKYAEQRGRNKFQRLIEPKRYIQISKNVAIYVAQELGTLFSRRSGASLDRKFPLYDAVFNAGKKIGIALQMIEELWSPSHILQWQPNTGVSAESVSCTKGHGSGE